MELTLPLILTQETFLLSHTRVQRHLSMQATSVRKWLEWHLGAFAKHGLHPPLTITLTRLADDALPPETLRSHLESTRAGIESWLLDGRDSVETHWEYKQQPVVTARNYLVAMRIEGKTHV